MEEIRKEEGYLVSEGIRRLRTGQVEKKSPDLTGNMVPSVFLIRKKSENPNGQMCFLMSGKEKRNQAFRRWIPVSRRLTQKKTEELSGLSVEDREESVAEKQKETIEQLNEKQKQAA